MSFLQKYKVIHDDNPRKIKQHEEEMQKIRIRNSLSRSNIPQDYLDMIMTSELKQTQIITRLLKIVKQRKIIILSGDYGTGKTIACLLAIKQLEAGYFITVSKYLDALFSKEQKDKNKVFWAKDCLNLILDEVGLEKGEQSKYVEDLICDRYSEVGITFITTNLSKDSFKRKYSERLVSRVNHVGEWIECNDKLRPNGGVL